MVGIAIRRELVDTANSSFELTVGSFGGRRSCSADPPARGGLKRSLSESAAFPLDPFEPQTRPRAAG